MNVFAQNVTVMMESVSNMNKVWYEIYEENKRLDEVFINRYKDSDPDFIKKNCIEFLVEMGEFVNETKCFKYWTVKKPDKEKVLDEFADCITILLTFFNYLNLDLENMGEHYSSTSILEVINNTYLLGTELLENCTEELVKKIFSNLMYISELLDLREEEVIDATFKKLKIVEERLNSNY